MSSLPIQIAQAVVDNLTTTPPTLPASISGRTLTTSRAYTPRRDLARAGQAIQISVVPAEYIENLESRTSTDEQVGVLIGIQARAESTDIDTLDALMSLSQGIPERFRFTRLDLGDGQPKPAWVATENEALYDPRRLIEDGEFLSVWTIYFRL